MHANEKILNEKEEKLIKALFIRTKIATPFFFASLIFAVIMVLPIMIIDISTHNNTDWHIALIFIIVPPTISFICWAFFFISSRVIVKGEKWTTILKKIKNDAKDVELAEQRRSEQAINAFATYAAGDITDAEEIGTAISGVMVGVSIFGLMSAINEHAKKVAEMTNTILPNITTKKACFCIILIPSLILIILFSLVYGLDAGKKYKKVSDTKSSKMQEMKQVLIDNTDERYNIIVDDTIADVISVDVTKKDRQTGIKSSMLLSFDKNNDLEKVSYSIEFADNSKDDYATVHYNKPNKDEALNIAINEIISLNDLLKKLNLNNELTTLYLPSDEFKQVFLSTDNWEEVKNENEIGYQVGNINNVDAYYSVDNSNLGTISYSKIYLYVTK